jgi:hypothetical protein
MASSKNEKIKKIAVLTLFGALVVVGIYQVFFSAPTPKPKLNKNIDTPVLNTATTSTTPSGSKPKQQQSASAARQALIDAALSDLTPLDLPSTKDTGGSATPGWRQNIFAVWIEPPKPPPPPPPPPPITLQSIQPQSAVAGTPRPITVEVFAAKVPPDGKVYIDGRVKDTKRIGESQFQVQLSAQEYASPGTMNFEIKSVSDPATWHSNQVPFISQPAPEPPFKMVGRLGELGVFEMSGSRDIKRAGRGATLQGTWRIDSISDTGADVTQTQYEIRRHVQMQEKGR